MKRLLLAIVSLAAATAFAAEPAPAWRPSPDMVGTFRSIADNNVLVVSPDAGIKLDFDDGDDVFAGTFRPDPSGTPGRYLAKARRILAFAAEDDEPETGFLVLSFEVASAWQLLGMGETPGEMEWLEERCVEKRNGIVRYEKEWFENRFVSDQPLPAGAPEITPEAARQRLVGVWENFSGGFGGVTVMLAADGHGIFGASVAAMPCSWRIRKTDDGWLLACKVYEGGNTPAQIKTSFALLKADPHLHRLQLLAADSTLEAATAAAEALDPDEPRAYLYRSSDTFPPEFAEQLSAAIKRINAALNP
ncbi:MAG: hypothetical protein IJS32_06295 [Kiritimatiellae bacterium]|nr:hypothetical protein [Kiritimatiellia bacterium]